VGYNTNTFNSTTIAANGGPWLLDNFYGQSTNAGQVVQEANGSMSFPGTTGTVGMVSTAHLDSSKPNNWAGLAFGGGAYMEATLSMVGEYVGDRAASWPAWWSSDIERAAYNGVSSNYPGVQWQGQAAEFQHYIEVDFLEYAVVGEGPAAPVQGDEGEEPLLDLVPLARAGQEMAHGDGKSLLGSKAL
jgi:hypothetical protein